jgi:hypothetical protein
VNSIKSYLSRRAGCLYRQTASSWNILDTFSNVVNPFSDVIVIICQQPEDSTMFQNLPRGSMGFREVLQGSVRFYEVPQGFTRFHEVP